MEGKAAKLEREGSLELMHTHASAHWSVPARPKGQHPRGPSLKPSWLLASAPESHGSSSSAAITTARMLWSHFNGAAAKVREPDPNRQPQGNLV